MSLRDQFLSAANGNPTHAAVDLARRLMAPDPAVFKAGYSHVNAVMAAAELFPEVAVDAVHALIDLRLAERGARRDLLVDHFRIEPWALESGDADQDARRYAAVCGITAYQDAHLTTYDDLQAALDDLAANVVEGLAPDAVYDLDTAARIDVHVSTPLVTPSDLHDLAANPLRS